MMRRGFPLMLRGLFLLMALIGGSAEARAEYQLTGGDVIEINVFKVPELSRQVTVDLDGRIAFPPLGSIDVTGTTTDQVGAKLRGLLIGQEILSDPQVTVALVAARPVFVGGDVASPGQYPYRGDLTVRRALALAGGVGVARDRAPDEMADLRGERRVLSADLFREQARLARLRAEAEGRDTIDSATLGAAATGPEAREILLLEESRLRADQAEAREERAHLERSVKLVQDRIETLTAQQEIQKRVMENQTAEIARIRDIQDRGLASQARVVEERRAFESMQERAADSAAEISAVRGQLEDVSYALARFDERRRAALDGATQDSLVAIKGFETRLRGLDERLAQLGLAARDQITVTIHRAAPGGEQALTADENTPLLPGDMVEVVLDIPDIGAAANGQPTQ